MKQHTRRIMVDEIAYVEAAAKLIKEHDDAAYEAGTDPDEIAALHWILSRTLAEHAAMLFRGND